MNNAEIRTCPNYEDFSVSERGDVFFKGKPKNKMKGTYLSVYGNGRNIKIHHLVADAFFGKRPVGLVINHKDGNKHNNAVENLEYCTGKENVRHAIRTGLMKHAGTPLDDFQILTILTMYKLVGARKVLAHYKKSYDVISRIKKGLDGPMLKELQEELNKTFKREDYLKCTDKRYLRNDEVCRNGHDKKPENRGTRKDGYTYCKICRDEKNSQRKVFYKVNKNLAKFKNSESDEIKRLKNLCVDIFTNHKLYSMKKINNLIQNEAQP